MKHRLVALDWMRGIVIILMVLDHASRAFNSGKLSADRASTYTPGMQLPVDQFFLRWVTHLCAPTFVFLAGTALAISVHRHLAAGESERSIDRHLLLRGLFIAMLDPLWVTPFWTHGSSLVLQVLYGIGTSLMAMALLRRLPPGWLLGLGLVIAVGNELLVGAVLELSGGNSPGVAGALLVHGGAISYLRAAYPIIPWLGIMMLGWAAGQYLGAKSSLPAERAARISFWLGVCALAVFAFVRGLDSYGNMGLPRDEWTLVRWLNVSKYPPSLSFITLELGLMAVILAGLFRIQSRLSDAPWQNNPFLVFGQTALFLYVLHIPLIELSSRGLGVYKAGGPGATLVATLGLLIVMYPACRWYRAYKAAHPHGWTRYL